RGRRMRVARLIAVGTAIHFRNLTSSRFYLITAVFMPLVLATVAFFMLRAGAREGSLLSASLRAGGVGIWSSALFGSGGASQWERWGGRLEVLVAAPAPFALVLFPLTLANSAVGIYSIATTVLWGRLVFGVPLAIHDWPAFLLSIPITVLG